MIAFGLFVLISSYAHVSGQETIKGPPGEHGSEYILIKEKLTFDQLAAKCTLLGANLPTPKTQAELDFVFQYAEAYVFLGAKREQVNGRCVAKWLVDGSEVTNANWHNFLQPCGGDYACVELGSSKSWYTGSCSTASHPQGLCQRKSNLEQVADFLQPHNERVSLALTNIERQLGKNKEQAREVQDKSDKKIDSLSANMRLLIGLMKDMSTEFKEYKKKVDVLSG